MAEDGEVKKISKISSLIDQAKEEESNKLQITVHYSENNWKTNEEINLILDENTTINQLIDFAKKKLTNKENINKKKFDVRIFKKKKKIPNEEYPVCNMESLVKDYGKSHFCLVNDENEMPMKKEEEKTEEKKEEKKENNIKNSEIKNEITKNKDKYKDNNEPKKDNKNNKDREKGKSDKTKKKCVIF